MSVIRTKIDMIHRVASAIVVAVTAYFMPDGLLSDE